ncbi:MAG TPA: adenosine kinase [Hadesarchaea archaeon]|nr:adenosine kinase [Hadesarchaea archaeon]
MGFERQTLLIGRCHLNEKYDVFGIGTALVDYFVRSNERILKENGLEKGSTNFLPREKLDKLHVKLSRSIFACFPGDNARNVCEGISFLGGRSAYAGRVGEDMEGEFFQRSLNAQRIESLVEEKPGRTGKTITFITPDFQRTFAADLGNGIEYESLPASHIKNSRFLYLTSITLLSRGNISKNARKALNFAGKTGVQIAISLENPPMILDNKNDLMDIVSSSNVLFANEAEMKALIGSSDEKKMKNLLENIPIIYLKKGKNGSVLLSRKDRYVIPAYPTRVVDTTGAGDFYAAGVLFGLSRGQSAEKAGHKGAKLAAKVIERFGATLSSLRLKPAEVTINQT